MSRIFKTKVFWFFLVFLGTVVFVFSSVTFSREYDVSASLINFFKKKSDFKMSEKIREGIVLLKESPPLEYVQGSKRQIALAILNQKTGEIFEKRLWITSGGKIVENNPDIPIKIKWWNGYNSVFETINRPYLTVVANKYLVERENLPENAILKMIDGAPQSRYADIVYSPYSEAIHQQDVVDMGIEYVNEKVSSAYKELTDEKILSRAREGDLVANVIPSDIIKNIVLIEHIDPSSFKYSDDNGKSLAERTLVIIGANQEWAYRYVSSFAGANGMAQFIEPTYSLIVDRYSSASLIKNYSIGMTDHENAFKAMALLLDNEMTQLQKEINIPVTKTMLAAAYNGGTANVIRAVKANKDKWRESSVFPQETLDYIKKYDMIDSLELFKTK